MESNKIDVANLNTSYPGFIHNFNAENQTCEVQLAIENMYVSMGESGFQQVQREKLVDVPVQFVRGGGWSLTFPIPDGTPCYVHFAQRGIDHWLMEGKDSAGMITSSVPSPQFYQRFSHNNAVAIVGINPVTHSISSFATDGVELRNKDHDQVLSLKGDGSINLVTGSSTLNISKDGNVSVNTEAKAIIKADGGITLDGETTITKTLTVAGKSSLNGGVDAKGGEEGEASMNITGKMKITETINDVQIETHLHPYDWTDGPGNSNTSPPIKVSSVTYSLIP
ncbi:Gp138 family membrane-puncturing spike protein [Lelliottia wanjuensis]|uniref:Gp138 family membrane-puncturing spike protein n=1 Tax=Lelliottia wanjuensis TaxID=3050585 RepID=A0AAP4FZ61_9ENTR|nr:MULTISPECIES: Gp138 family membrane-puncturing spike protein [unclassified Lelliottia]MDK9366446.1 Gp138 family membrane-puncturing spike protein [Lelliottia sp. V106_12]MDK9618685.1 Gp138 family membrane-puncturing spike protein [Lelliottia sp. V106_9]